MSYAKGLGTFSHIIKMRRSWETLPHNEKKVEVRVKKA